MVDIKGRLCTSIKALSDAASGRGPFEGDLSTYGNIDLGGDVCEAGCFDRSVAGGTGKFPLLWQHRDDDPIGSFEVVSTEGTLRIKGEFNLDTEHGRAGYSLLRNGDIDGLSIGYNVRDYSYDRDGIRHLTDVELMEGSLVTFPMNPLARAEAVKSRRSRMSRYAACQFLKALSDEERDAALAELDELDREDAKEGGEPKDPEPSKEPEKEPEKPAGGSGKDPESKEGAPEDENTDGEQSDNDELAKACERVKASIDELRRLMEA